MSDLDTGIRAFRKGQYKEAAEIFFPLAEAGELEAQRLLSRMYYVGNGVEQSREQYLYWLEKAAEQGDKPSRSKLKRVK